jgi:hypothetical protein
LPIAQVTRQQIVEVLRTAGLPEAADEANRSLPEQLDMERAAVFLGRHGITKDALISRMGGQPVDGRRAVPRRKGRGTALRTR